MTETAGAPGQSIVELPGEPVFRSAYARTLGRFILSTEQLWTIGDAVGYIVQVGIDLSRRPSLVEPVRVIFDQAVVLERTRTSGNWLWRNIALSQRTAGAKLRVRYPQAAIRFYQAHAADITTSWRSPVEPSFREFACLAVMVTDVACGRNPELMDRLLKIWPVSRYGLQPRGD